MKHQTNKKGYTTKSQLRVFFCDDHVTFKSPPTNALLLCIVNCSGSGCWLALSHRLRTPNEGINQRYLKKLGRCGRQYIIWQYLKIWDWDWFFGRAVKTISSLGVRSPWLYITRDWNCFANFTNFWIPLRSIYSFACTATFLWSFDWLKVWSRLLLIFVTGLVFQSSRNGVIHTVIF